jgi:hypothetical protein
VPARRYRVQQTCRAAVSTMSGDPGKLAGL